MRREGHVESETGFAGTLLVVAKADLQLRDRRYGLDEMRIDFGIGWLF